MYNRDLIADLEKFIASKDGISNKTALSIQVQKRYSLVKERSVFYGEWFAIRFSTATSKSFGNTVLALSTLHKYDTIPFIVCLVTPSKNYMLLANTTFLKKISHTSQQLRVDNIRGSFNGSDIMRTFEGIENVPQNFEFLFTSHENYTFEENLERLVEATNNIAPTGKRFYPTTVQSKCIYESISRSISFLASNEYTVLNQDLCSRVQAVESEIAIAAFIDNVNLRGRIIEYLITAADDLKTTLIDCLHRGNPLPEIFTADKLGDYGREFDIIIQKQTLRQKLCFCPVIPKVIILIKCSRFLRPKGVCIWFILLQLTQTKRFAHAYALCTIDNYCRALAL